MSQRKRGAQRAAERTPPPGGWKVGQVYPVPSGRRFRDEHGQLTREGIERAAELAEVPPDEILHVFMITIQKPPGDAPPLPSHLDPACHHVGLAGGMFCCPAGTDAAPGVLRQLADSIEGVQTTRVPLSQLLGGLDPDLRERGLASLGALGQLGQWMAESMRGNEFAPPPDEPDGDEPAPGQYL